MMHGPEKSDLLIVPKKPANKAGRSAAESVEGRSETKGNAELQSTARTQSRAAVSQAQSRIREAVNRCKISRNGPARFRVNGPTLDGLPAEPQFERSTRPFSLRQVFAL